MRPVVVTAVLLLVVLMSMSDAAWTPKEMCRTKYPANYCRKDLGPGWHQYGPNFCVKAYYAWKMTHATAKAQCRKQPKGDLVSIHNLNELCMVECAMWWTSDQKFQYWIGLERSFLTFVWSNGSKYKYTHWARGQPDNAWWNEYCIEMNYGGWGLWNDAPCGMGKPFVCSVDIR